MNENIIEVSNLHMREFCILNLATGEEKYSREQKEELTYGGHYFRDEKTFFVLYPTKEGPFIFYEGKTYPITKDLTINVVKNGKNRIFTISEYEIEIHYKEYRYLNFDAWSREEDIDLFYIIFIEYKTESFYKEHTK